ncbi:MAG: pyridoxamine 5'-phosphate oxidase family protein [Thermogemmatispora sp.]|uniref:pyridoxamine 5'-phosphate oxidase family protein n=1 Tax=Thermogemmatispora sp. TaxID=1968838 RepID=UPI002623A153|nr:pyridoxamine 5'-phosphate oxidase family protein [Thermogemmatispora sp.]MBX5457246.1 pyridoxamine 5'-phosphate oxidase family protein [Thermogemmatispora sp.]
MEQPSEQQELHHIRRRDRAVNDESWIRNFLQRAPVGVLATVEGEQPFLNSNLFVYDEAAHAIYIHTAARGRTRRNVESSERVCFTVYEMGRLLPAKTALDFSVEYASVVVFGQGAIIQDRERARAALHLLLKKYAPHLEAGHDYRAVTDEELKRTSVYEIRISAWSGKKKEAAPDSVGAYYYGEEPQAQWQS